MKLVTLTAASALFAGTAFAGGIAPAPYEPVPMAPAPIAMPTTDWTGGYAGASLGWGRGDAEIDGVEVGPQQSSGFLSSLRDEADADGVIGGVFAGYQYDFGQFVLGAELDLNTAHINSDDEIDANNNTVEDLLDIDQVHRLKLRAGYDLGNTLIYGTAGAAYAKAEFNGTDYEGVGGVIGAGVDYKVTPNVVVGAEVLYHKFDDFDDTGLEADATSIQGRVAYQF